MPKMTPEAEAQYALNFNVARSDLSMPGQLAYDQLPLSSSAFAASTYRTDPAPHAQGRFRLFRLLLRHAQVKSLAFTDPGCTRSWNQ
jgi:hypothetical protein